MYGGEDDGMYSLGGTSGSINLSILSITMFSTCIPENPVSCARPWTKDGCDTKICTINAELICTPEPTAVCTFVGSVLFRVMATSLSLTK